MLHVSLTNRSGHKLPAEVPSRVLIVAILVDGQEEIHSFRRPPKGIVGVKDNRLLPGETRHITRSVAGARSVKVEIFYQQSPFVVPKGWIVIGRWEKGD